ncbi:MAG: asparaginase [Burkholderiaceae bacterium]|jgi:glutamin-(asparagin-)ase|nr:asparaginase [Burkholderiaceae bacterium]
MSADRPRIALLATGGTIAGAAASRTATGYQAGVIGPQALLAAVPELADVADVQAEQLFAIDSKNMSDALMLQLARRASELLAESGVAGLVITHGTDTLEESAYLLHLLLKSAKPVVFTGAMRPGNALSTDGPANLYQAACVAASPAAAGLGVLVVMNGAIWSARDVGKQDAAALHAFGSPHGPLGRLAGSSPRFYRAPSRAHTLHSQFSLQRLHALPPVGIVSAWAGMSAAPYEALAASGARGIVHAGFGAATVPDHLLPTLRSLRARGLPIVRASRTGAGPLPCTSDLQEGGLLADDQNPLQARLLLALGLAHGADTAGLQELFMRY